MYIFNYTKFSKLCIHLVCLCARHFSRHYKGFIHVYIYNIFSFYFNSHFPLCLFRFFSVFCTILPSSQQWPHIFPMNIMEIIRNQLLYFLSPLSSNLFIYYCLFNSLPFPCFSRTSNLLFPPFPSLPDV